MRLELLAEKDGQSWTLREWTERWQRIELHRHELVNLCLDALRENPDADKVTAYLLVPDRRYITDARRPPSFEDGQAVVFTRKGRDVSGTMHKTIGPGGRIVLVQFPGQHGGMDTIALSAFDVRPAEPS